MFPAGAPVSVIAPGPVRLATDVPFRSSSTAAAASTPETSKTGLATLVTLSVLLAPLSLVLCKSGALGVAGTTLMAADTEKPSTVAEALPCPPADPADHIVDPADELSRNPLVGFTVPLTPEKLIATPVGLGKPNPEVLLELVLM